MQRAIELAKNGIGFVNPNPLVGAVIVKDNTIVAEGYHAKYGDLHAERNAFKYCDTNNIDCSNATMYVTLEPCCMCAGAILKSRLKKVYIGAMEKNFGCCGSAYNLLQAEKFTTHADVETGILESECVKLLQDFFKERRKK